MTLEVKVPRLPESVTDATLVTWHKAAGDMVERDENLADLETDKVVLEVPAPARGVLKEIVVQSGATVTSGDLLARLDPSSDSAQPSKPAAVPASKSTKAAATLPAAQGAPAAVAPAASRSPARAGPAVRRLAREQGIDPASIAGSGKGGRVLKEDLLPEGKASASIPAASKAKAEPPMRAPEAPAGGRGERRVAMSRLRSRIAERLVEAQHSAAMLTTFNEVDLSEVIALRTRYKDAFEQQHGVKLGFMAFFAKAAIEGLKRYPVINASVEGNEIIYHDYYDLGIAVSTERGLLVPVVRNADQMPFAGIEVAIGDFGRRARDGSISMDELSGGTFTITNGGVFGSLLSTPILNPPQSGIMGMHKIQQRAMVVDGAVVARPMMYLALTYDHRIVDGRDAVQFLVTVKDALEDPARLLLGV